MREHDHEQPEVTMADRSESTKTADLRASFECDPKCFSMTESDLLSVAKDDWHCPSPELFRNMGAYTLLLVQAAANPELLRGAWQALLFKSGYLVKRKGEKKLAYVCAGSFQDGVFLIRLNTVKATLKNGEKLGYLELPTASNEEFYVVELVHSHEDFDTCPLKVLSPLSVAEIFRGTDQNLWPAGAVLLPGRVTSVLEAAMWDSFSKLTIFYMIKLEALLGMIFEKGKTPKTEKQHLEALVRHVSLGLKMTEEEMLNILNQCQERARRSALSAGDSVCVHGENLHLPVEALEQDKIELLTKAKGAYHEARRPQLQLQRGLVVERLGLMMERSRLRLLSRSRKNDRSRGGRGRGVQRQGV